jgi:endoglucanase
MSRRIVLKALLVGTALALVPATASAQGSGNCGFLAETGVPPQRLSALARGFNLTGWLDGEGTQRPSAETLTVLYRRGFTHIRLPVAPERLLPEFSRPDNVARDRGELDAALDLLIGIGFAVSIDIHPGERFERLHKREPEHGFALLDALWRDLARRYAAYRPDRVFFEILNEPGVSQEIWNTQGPRIAATIRDAAPNHTIVYGPADFQQIGALPEPLALTNVVYAVHYYAPMVFTHQGLDWSDDPLRYLGGVPFPVSRSDPAIERQLRDLHFLGRDEAASLLEKALQQKWDENRVAGEVSRAGEWSRRHRRAVVLNEFGVLAWKATAVDRLRWLETVRRAAERACVGWAHWDYADAFGFVRRVGGKDIPDQAVLKALLGDRTPRRARED